MPQSIGGTETVPTGQPRLLTSGQRVEITQILGKADPDFLQHAARAGDAKHSGAQAGIGGVNARSMSSGAQLWPGLAFTKAGGIAMAARARRTSLK